MATESSSSKPKKMTPCKRAASPPKRKDKKRFSKHDQDAPDESSCSGDKGVSNSKPETKMHPGAKVRELIPQKQETSLLRFNKRKRSRPDHSDYYQGECSRSIDENSDSDFEPEARVYQSPKTRKLTPRKQRASPSQARVKKQLSTREEGPVRVRHSSRISSLVENIRMKRSRASCGQAEEIVPRTSGSHSDTDPDIKNVPANPAPDCLYSRTSDLNSENVDMFLERASRIIQEAHQILSRNSALASNQRIVTLRRELAEMGRKARLPETVIALVGDTGAGKSSLLNALLGQGSVLPTSGMRACTAVVVEVKNNPGSLHYVAEIEFLAEEEWYRELKILLKELEGSDGRVRKRMPDPNSDAVIAWSKICAVYGTFKDGVTLDFFMKKNKVTSLLGKRKIIEESSATALRRKVEDYIESADRGRGGQYWPIVRKVTMRLPGCTVCSSGATLVDLPGVRDSNAARDKIAKEYLKNCTAVWVVADIARAVDNKTAKDLLGEQFRRQLLMDGQYGTVSFICTKTDIISPSEIKKSLPIRHDVVEHEEALEPLNLEEGRLQEQQEQLKTELADLAQKARVVREQLLEAEDDLFELTQEKEKAESQDMEEPPTEEMETLIEEMSATKKLIQEKGAAATNIRLERRRKEKLRETNKLKLSHLQQQIAAHNKSISAICAMTRNNFAQDQIRHDFRAGLQEIRWTSEMEAEHLPFPDEEQLEVKNLKVFCVSSTDCLKLRHLLPREDGPPQVFQNVEDTGIPTLEKHVHTMTQFQRLQGTEELITNIRQSLVGLETYLEDKGTECQALRTQVHQFIQQETSRLLRETLARAVEKVMEGVNEMFQSKIGQKLGQGTRRAVNKAESTVAQWSAPVNRANRSAGGLHHQTYSAACRRHGEFRSPTAGNVDFNQDLADPVLSTISSVWDEVFNLKLWQVLQNCKLSTEIQVKSFSMQVNRKLVSFGVDKDRLALSETSLINRVKYSLNEELQKIKSFIRDRQQDVSRVLKPCIQQGMIPAYDKCNAEKGTGSFGRMRQHMGDHVAEYKQPMLLSSSQSLQGQLCELQTELRSQLEDMMIRVVGDCLFVYEPIWEEPSNSRAYQDAFLLGVKKCVIDIRQLAEEGNIPLEESQGPVSRSPQGQVKVKQETLTTRSYDLKGQAYGPCQTSVFGDPQRAMTGEGMGASAASSSHPHQRETATSFCSRAPLKDETAAGGFAGFSAAICPEVKPEPKDYGSYDIDDSRADSDDGESFTDSQDSGSLSDFF